MKSRILSLLIKSVLVGTGAGILSFLIRIVPCSIDSHWTLCNLPNPFASLPDLSTIYYGVSNNPLTGLVFQIFIPLVIFLIIFLSVRKKAGKMLDLTKK